MSCKVTGTSAFDCDFSCHSGRSVSDEECTIQSTTTGVRHIVTVTPVKKKFTDIRVTGRILADPNTAKANFSGLVVMANKIEWQESKKISTADVTFDSTEIRFVSAGTENIETIIEEKDRWTGQITQIDQNDLLFTITLS